MNTVLSFSIKQSQCASKVSIQGGAVMEIFAQSDSALGSCGFVDYFDNTYDVQCTFPSLPRKTEATDGAKKTSMCANTTVILMYEHFDGLSEVLLDWKHDYPPLRSLIADSVRYCTPSTFAVEGKEEDRSGMQVRKRLAHSLQGRLGLRIPPSIDYYAGAWVRHDAAAASGGARHIVSHAPDAIRSNTTAWSNFYGEYFPQSSSGVYLYRVFYKHPVDYTSFSAVAQQSLSTLAVQDPHETADRYVFVPILFTTGERLTAIQKKDTEVTQSHCIKQGFDERICADIMKHATLEERLQLHATTARPSGAAGFEDTLLSTPQQPQKESQGAVTIIDDRVITRNFTFGCLKPSDPAPESAVLHRRNIAYHFVGSSHMRYMFDAVSEYVFGLEVLRNVPRKHDQLVLGNLDFNFVEYARGMSDHLTWQCAILQNETNSADPLVRDRLHTLILQTGAWDLSVSSVRRILLDPIVGKRLVDVLEGIMTRSLRCGRVEQILWLTATPYQVCTDDRVIDCNAHRSYRFNSAIAALNSFYRNHLFRIAQDERSRRPGHPRLAIVDSFSIIRPRLVFNEDSEVACLNHYTCRSNSPIHRTYGDRYDSILVQTPGGTAAVKSVLNALSIGPLSQH
jgi:hypothetical protein